uniref:Uncharacterized protein n=1 Tax=Molossus molossus TaxID=27622 RepID=A0A7J8HZL9_MOLMO|nr:hypothetical protein HJG59_010739 [Molossus molossus]
MERERFVQSRQRGNGLGVQNNPLRLGEFLEADSGATILDPKCDLPAPGQCKGDMLRHSKSTCSSLKRIRPRMRVWWTYTFPSSSTVLFPPLHGGQRLFSSSQIGLWGTNPRDVRRMDADPVEVTSGPSEGGGILPRERWGADPLQAGGSEVPSVL